MIPNGAGLADGKGPQHPEPISSIFGGYLDDGTLEKVALLRARRLRRLARFQRRANELAERWIITLSANDCGHGKLSEQYTGMHW